jgi:branched-chain amino acid aminotransferase
MNATDFSWLYWYGDGWTTEERKILSARENSFWMANAVFDGARVYQGLVPDLKAHCARLGRSAKAMMLAPTLDDEQLEDLCREGAKMFPTDAELYIRPMYFARSGFIVPEANSTECLIVIHQAPMPGEGGFSANFSQYRRPAPDSAPTEAKACCLYPMTQRILADAAAVGFDTSVVLDGNGDVAEFATANLVLVKGAEVITPIPNGSFLSGITRARTLQLLRENGYTVTERRVAPQELYQADEIFSLGNYGKVQPLTRLDDKVLAVGPVTAAAIELYHQFALSERL